MTTDRRHFIKSMGLGLATTALAAEGVVRASTSSAGSSERLFVTNRVQPEPAPLGYDRLPLPWYKANVQRLKDRVKGVDAVVLESDKNKVYFSGCFRNSGERTTWVVFPTGEKDTAYWYGPAIDREMIQSWWCTEFEYYFCFPHTAGGYPNRGQVVQGPAKDLFAWLLEGLRKRGFNGKTIAMDKSLNLHEQAIAKQVLPDAKFIDISDDCLQMRIVKTPEEIALCQRAYRYFDRVHAFARDFILEHGTSVTDFEVGQALQAFAIRMMMADVKYDGRPHTAVGIDSTANYVNAGVSTAYPHANQFFYSKLKKGQPLYVNTDLYLGGMGGECYRNYLLAPWTEHQNKLWEVVAESVQIMVDTAKPGAMCSDVAFKVHQHQVKSGMQEYIYHRPGHGTGQNQEGHQAPFLALGDSTILKEGMMFSVEPGLFDPAHGFGINPSDNLLITKTGSVLMSRIPFSKEWSYLAL